MVTMRNYLEKLRDEGKISEESYETNMKQLVND
jgi:ribosomal protein L19E